MSVLQVCTSGTDEHLELCKATYELYHELKMNAPGLPPLVRPPACIMCTPRQCNGDGSPVLHCISCCGVHEQGRCSHLRLHPLPSPALQPWNGVSPYKRCDDDKMLAWPRSAETAAM